MLNGNMNDLKEWKHEMLTKVINPLLTRRNFVKAAVAGSLALGGLSFLTKDLLFAQGSSSKEPKSVKTGTFYFPRLMFHVKDETGDQWNIYPVGDVILRKRLKKLTNVNASDDPIVVRLADLDAMCRYPFVFATSEGYFDLPKNEEKNLKEFLMRGGFVYADDCVLERKGDRFFQDYVKMIKRIFPTHEMKRVPDDHEIYNCYFHFPKGAPFFQGINHGGYGLFEKGTGRLMTYATPGDLHCAWTCMFFNQRQNEAALKMGINIIIYYLTH
jgi:hypothetical protein